jgi:hypothetical protein
LRRPTRARHVSTPWAVSCSCSRPARQLACCEPSPCSWRTTDDCRQRSPPCSLPARRSPAANFVPVLDVPPTVGFPILLSQLFQVRSTVLALHFAGALRVCGLPLGGSCATALQAAAGAHAAFCDVAPPARLAGEEALQVERFGFITADDVACHQRREFHLKPPV